MFIVLSSILQNCTLPLNLIKWWWSKWIYLRIDYLRKLCQTRVYEIRKTWRDLEDCKRLKHSFGCPGSFLFLRRGSTLSISCFSLVIYLHVVFKCILVACSYFKLILLSFDFIKLKFKLNCRVFKSLYEGFNIWVLVKYIVLFNWIRPL